MSLDAGLVLALAAQCAPGVAPQTLLAVARAESALDPLAIGVNGPAVPRRPPAHPGEAAGQARALIAAGRNIDLGLAQINVRNLARLGLSIEEAFDPCRNLAAASQVLKAGYARGAARSGPGQAALRIALSYYNTGDPARGFHNGYVARVEARAGTRSPIAPRALAAPAAARPSRAIRLRVAQAFVISPMGAAP